MKSGSREIQKAIERRTPVYWPKKSWMRDVARDLGCTYLQAENIYYRKNRTIPNDIYLKLISPRISPQSEAKSQDKRLEENLDLREELREIKSIIKSEQAARNARLKLILEAFAG